MEEQTLTITGTFLRHPRWQHESIYSLANKNYCYIPIVLSLQIASLIVFISCTENGSKGRGKKRRRQLMSCELVDDVKERSCLKGICLYMLKIYTYICFLRDTMIRQFNERDKRKKCSFLMANLLQ